MLLKFVLYYENIIESIINKIVFNCKILFILISMYFCFEYVLKNFKLVNMKMIILIIIRIMDRVVILLIVWMYFRRDLIWFVLILDMFLKVRFLIMINFNFMNC